MRYILQSVVEVDFLIDLPREFQQRDEFVPLGLSFDSDHDVILGLS